MRKTLTIKRKGKKSYQKIKRLIKMKLHCTLIILLVLVCWTPSQAIGEETLAKGPLLEKRQQALNYIKKAEKYGVGIKPYMQAFNKLEADVKKGISEKEIKRRVDSITKSAYQQMLRARQSKMRRRAL